MNNVYFYDKSISQKFNIGDILIDNKEKVFLQLFEKKLAIKDNLFTYNGNLKDFNENLKSGLYNITASTLNKPIQMTTGFVVVLDRIVSVNDIGETTINKNSYVQLQIICTTNKKVFFRILYNNSSKIESNIFELTQNANSVSQLNTLYYGEKMKQEGVCNDFITYMDEKTAYDKQQRKLEQDRQLAYEEALKENPNLSYEEFMSLQPMTLNLVEEPQPSQALQEFMEKYL